MKVKNRFLLYYVLMFLITTVIALVAFAGLSLLSGLLEDSLVKNRYTAESLMKHSIEAIDYQDVVANHGGLQVVDSRYQVILSQGIAPYPLNQKALTKSQFTEFLRESQSIHREFSYDIAYNEKEDFWLIVSFPTSIRVDFSITQNRNYESVDSGSAFLLAGSVLLAWLVLLALSTFLYSRMSAAGFTRRLSALQESASLFSQGDYTARAPEDSKDEFGELGGTFNQMADKIQGEMSLRKQSEDLRRQLTLDVAHDLKNPLAVVMGYAEQGIRHPDSLDERTLKLILENSSRANSLVANLFDLSRLESPEYQLQTKPTDLSEYLRRRMARRIDALEAAGFQAEFHIPEEPVYAELDELEMGRALDNLIDNALRYNEPGTKLSLTLREIEAEGKKYAEILLEDDGRGIPRELSDGLFKPFAIRESGSGLGLSIVQKIIELHGGAIYLRTDSGKGCRFTIHLNIHSNT